MGRMKGTKTGPQNSKTSGNRKNRTAPLGKRIQELRMITHKQAELGPLLTECHPTPPEQGEQDWIGERKRLGTAK